jgi:hypothetical protein
MLGAKFYSLIFIQFREKKSGKDVRLKDDPVTENGHAAEKSESAKKVSNGNRKQKPAKKVFPV